MLLLHRCDVRYFGWKGRLLSERVLATGALGCVDAWAVKAAFQQGDEPVGYDLGDATHRLELSHALVHLGALQVRSAGPSRCRG